MNWADAIFGVFAVIGIVVTFGFASGALGNKRDDNDFSQRDPRDAYIWRHEKTKTKPIGRDEEE